MGGDLDGIARPGCESLIILDIAAFRANVVCGQMGL